MSPPPKHRGEPHPQATLTEAKVREIIQRLAKGEAASEIAPDFGVTRETIGNLARGINWTHIPRPPNFASLIRRANVKLNKATVREILAMKKAGLSISEIAARTGVLPGNVWNIVNGQTWRHIPRD